MENKINIKEINEKIEKESAFIDLILFELNKTIVGQKHMIERLLIGLLGKGSGGKSVAGNLAWDIREAIKGKELDPEKLIELQTKINAVEAQHRTLFVAGWRPFIGWICGVALAYNFVIRDLFIWVTKTTEAPPALQMDHLMTVLLGMLGLGGLRTYEKIKGKDK